MKCQKCGKHIANTHIKRVINGVQEEYHLCSECARSMGCNNVFESFSESVSDVFGSMLGGFFANALPARSQATRCDTCGSTFSDITRSGLMGCADCYDLFEDQIMPSIRRVHGDATHCGKSSVSVVHPFKDEEKKPEETPEISELDSLKVQLDEAVKNQEFERAAELRDRIKALEETDE